MACPFYCKPFACALHWDDANRHEADAGCNDPSQQTTTTSNSAITGFRSKKMNTADLTTLKQGNVDSRSSVWRDWLGIAASIGCAIHCAAMPFVIAYLPALGLSFLADEAFHKWMALVCFLIAIVAFIPGIRKHGNWIPVSIGAAGLALITFAAFGLAGECCSSCSALSTVPVEELSGSIAADTACSECADCDHCESPATETSGSSPSLESDSQKDLLATLAPWITPFGGLLLVSAHLVNRRFGCLCDCCEA